MYPLNGKPLIEYTIDAALGSKYIDKDNIFVTSDWDELREFAKTKGVQTIERPKPLAEDHIWTQPVVDHAISTLNLENEDIIIILQANSPQMTSKGIDICINKLIENRLWQVNTVDKELINNGAIQVMRKKVCNHIGKPNYNGVAITDWVDVHTIEDIKKLEKK